MLSNKESIAKIVAYYRARSDLDALESCLALLERGHPESVAKLLSGLEPCWSDYAIASVYATLMGKRHRKALGAYFTPPGLVDYLLWRARQLGVHIASERIRDPAAGGAAFIVPIAREMIGSWRAEGLDDASIVDRLIKRLSGQEIDPDLATLANALLRRCIVEEFGIDRTLAEKLNVIRCEDTLALEDEQTAEHEIGNPPFLRLSSRDRPPNAARFDDINSGRLNLYSVFVRRGLSELPPGGILAYIIPASFIGGPEFELFRLRIRQMAEVLAIDMIEGRKIAFLDVIQDTCVLALRKRETEQALVVEEVAESNSVSFDGAVLSKGMATLPDGNGPWILPGSSEQLPSNLAEWGYAPRVGYLVANRQADRLHPEAGPGRLPLIWAKSIGQDGRFDFERGKQFRELSWAEAPVDATYVVRKGCVAMQRTSARGQSRRIAAAEIPRQFIERHGGIIAENHVILLLPIRDDAAPAAMLAEALNRPEVGQQLDRMCGSASIPVGLLKQLPLPKAPAR